MVIGVTTVEHCPSACFTSFINADMAIFTAIDWPDCHPFFPSSEIVDGLYSVEVCLSWSPFIFNPSSDIIFYLTISGVDPTV